ncbi:hypothetical protein NC651_012852 [Populus alba x Populus x berolinensis]|nr:hypothetical protein NC651_012852 [Populus alba x Populus x berolinensis]
MNKLTKTGLKCWPFLTSLQEQIQRLKNKRTKFINGVKEVGAQRVCAPSPTLQMNCNLTCNLVGLLPFCVSVCKKKQAWKMASVNLYCSFLASSRLQGHYTGLHCVCPFVRRGHLTYLGSGDLAKKLCFSFKRDGRAGAGASSISGEGDVLSYPNDNIVSGQDKFVNRSPGVELQPDAIGFGTLSGEITPSTGGFFADNDEYDLDRPTEGCASIPEAIEDIHQGKMVIVVDDEDRENEGDLIMAASKATPEAMAFIVKHGTGIVCVSMKAEDLERLELPLMVTHKENEEKLCTAFAVSVEMLDNWCIPKGGNFGETLLDCQSISWRKLSKERGAVRDAKHGTSTGVSAHDRATTTVALASKDSKPEDFNRPGHIFPLKYREGGVLKRAGHTEASVDLAMLAGLEPVAVLCEIVDDDGSMARLPRLRQFAQVEHLKIISIADLIRFCLHTVENSLFSSISCQTLLHISKNQ